MTHPDYMVSCYYDEQRSDHTQVKPSMVVPLVASATNIAYELLCFVLVVSKTYRGYRVPHGSKTQPQLTYLLIRDGEGVICVYRRSLSEHP